MKAWSEFLKDVMPHVPGCPEPVAEFALKRAAQEFFETTRLWKLWLVDQTTEADRTDYFLILEPHSQLVRLERATLDGREIEVRAEEDLPADWQTYPQCVETGVHTTDRDGLVLVPAQAADKVLKVEASLKPSDDAQGIDNLLFAHHARQIACGAVADLKGQADKTYSDPDGSLLWRSRFEGHMNVVEFQRRRGFSSSRPRPRVKTF